MRKIYLIGSLRNPDIQATAEVLRFAGHEVFDDWYAAGPKADDEWQAYERTRGRSYTRALNGRHARSAFAHDKKWLDWADTGVLVLPAGKSGHLEIGYLVGRGADCHILMDGEPERFDLMYRFVSGVWTNMNDLIVALDTGGVNVR